MVLYWILSLIPITYGGMYVVFSCKRKRKGQAAAVAALLLTEGALLSLLAWEYLAMP